MPKELIGSTLTCWEQTAIDIALSGLKNVDPQTFVNLNRREPTYITVTSMEKRIRFKVTNIGFVEPQIVTEEVIHPASQLFHAPK